MSLEETLSQRSNGACELCTSTNNLTAYQVPPESALASMDNNILVCDTCAGQITSGDLDANHWRCLNDSMWSQVLAVQVAAFRLLTKLSTESWAQDALEMMYLDEDTRKWAETSLAAEHREVTLDSNGAALAAGDNVTLIKDLDVKGANFTAKRGTVVRGISLSDNPLHVEGRVNGSRIVIIAAYCKKA